MVTDKDFYVENYVGTYRIEFCEDLNEIVIVSHECILPVQGEKKLRKERLFEYGAKNDDYLYLALANVDVDSDSSILAYCNKYGLPYSSQLIWEKRKWLGPDVDVETASRSDQVDTSTFCRNDMMTKAGFCEMVVIVRKLIRLRTLINEKSYTDASYTELTSTLLFFIFFSHSSHYDYSPNEYALPRERLMRFQYEFQLFSRKRNQNQEDRYSYCHTVSCFLASIEQQKCEKYINIESTHLRADISSAQVGLVIATLAPVLYSKDIDGCISSTNLFTYESFGFCQ